MSTIISAGREFSTQEYEEPDYGANEQRRYSQSYPLIVFKQGMLAPLSADDRETMFRENRIAVLEQIIIGNRRLMSVKNAWYVTSVDDFKRISLINKGDYPESTFIELPTGGVLILSENRGHSLSPSIFTNMDSAIPHVDEVLKGWNGEIIAVRHIDNWGRKLIWYEGIHYVYEAQPIINIDNKVYESFKIWKLYESSATTEARQFLILKRLHGHFIYSVFDVCKINNFDNMLKYIKDAIDKNNLFKSIQKKGAAKFVEYYNNAAYSNKASLTKLQDLFEIVNDVDPHELSDLKFRKWILILHLIKSELQGVYNIETINKMVDLLTDF